MKRKTLTTGLIVLYSIALILPIATVKAQEMFFVDFYVVDSQGNPLNGVEIEVKGIYNYHEFTYTGSGGYAPRLALFSDQRNAHYTYTATYNLNSESGDFYVPNNYNTVNIVISDVSVPTPTPSPVSSPTSTDASSPTPTPTQNPTNNPTSNPIATPVPTPTPTSTPTTTLTPTPTKNTQTTAPTNSPIIPELSYYTLIVAAILLTTALLLIQRGRVNNF